MSSLNPNSNHPELLNINDLAIHFGGIMALAGIDLQIEEGEIVVVIGPNGSGKTTLFNCISGFYRPDQGEILFQGESLWGSPLILLPLGGLLVHFRTFVSFFMRPSSITCFLEDISSSRKTRSMHC